MPYSGPGDTNLPDNVKELPENKREQWVNVFNSALKRCQGQDEPGDDCEAVAFRQANGVVFEELALFTRPGSGERLSAREVELLAEGGDEWAVRVAAKLARAAQAADGETQVTIEAHALEKGTETEERAVSEMMIDYAPVGPRTFADLHAAQTAQETAEQIHTLAYQYHSLILNAIRHDEGVLPALAGLNQEFLMLVAEALGESAVEEVELGGEGAMVELAEAATGHALQISESDNGVNRRAPLDLDIVIIQPGFGNKRDNHYYGPQMLAENAAVFAGAKMYSTDHREDEKSVRTEVSRIKEIVGFDDGGAPIGRVKVFDPDFAELVRNRADAGELQSLECSILANGTARKGNVNGQEAKIVEAITEVRSVDWVTKAGAGGHALRIAESEDMSENERQPDGLEEAELEEVVIEEEAQVEPEPQGEESQEEPVTEAAPEPAFLSEAEVEALIPDHLPAETRERLLARQYQSEEDAKRSVVVEVDYLRAVTGGGKPFGQRGKAAPHPVTNLAEAAEKQRERQNAVNDYWFGR